MITEKDLQEAIAECQGQRNPNASTCIKLAAFLTIQKELYGEKQESPIPSYSYASEPREPIIDYGGESEFARLVDGKRQDFVMPVMDELMDVLMATQPRLYDGVLRKLGD